MFSENNYFFQKVYSEELALFLQICLMSGFIEDPGFSYLLLFNLVQFLKKFHPHTDTQFEEGTVVIAFPDNCQYSSLILYQNFTI